MRGHKEFAYGGDGTVKRPELNKEVSDEKWNEFVYLRKSPRGKHIELWHHIAGLLYDAITQYVYLLDFFSNKQTHSISHLILLYLTQVFLQFHLRRKQILYGLSFRNMGI